MLKILCNKFSQYHLIKHTIDTLSPDTPSELLEAKAKCLTELRFLITRIQLKDYSKTLNSFNGNKQEIMRAFQKDLSDKTVSGMDFNQVMQHPDTIVWLRIVKEVNRYRLKATTNIEDHMNFTHEQWNIGIYYGKISLPDVKEYFLNFVTMHDLNYVLLTIIGSAGG